MGNYVTVFYFLIELLLSQPFQILPWDMVAIFGRNHRGDEISGYSLFSNNLFNEECWL